jgi:nicotinamidase-related amidase
VNYWKTSRRITKTDLEKILNDKGIKTVVVVGTAAQGAVLNTASQAAFRGLRVIVPLDGMSAENTITSSTPPPIYQPLLASANR